MTPGPIRTDQITWPWVRKSVLREGVSAATEELANVLQLTWRMEVRQKQTAEVLHEVLKAIAKATTPSGKMHFERKIQKMEQHLEKTLALAKTISKDLGAATLKVMDIQI